MVRETTRPERSGWRDELFSKWHRSLDPDNLLTCMDVDWIEYCRLCKEAMAVFELTCDWNFTNKPITVTQTLAKRLDVFGYLLTYRGETVEDIEFRVRRLYPDPQPYGTFKSATARQVEALLWNIHRYCRRCGTTQEMPDGVPEFDTFGWCHHEIPAKNCYVCNRERRGFT
jgi:hypothetical protein